MTSKKKLVLAYSGGLDTSYCIQYLTHEQGFDVYTVLANTGGFSRDELEAVEAKAYRLGATTHTTVDICEEYYHRCIRYMIYGNVLRNGNYPISVSSERTFQAIAVIEQARKIGAKYIAHGSTGAGNDQVRFDMTIQTLAPEIEIITPIRDKKLSREEEIEYLKSKGVDEDWKKMEYSINQGIWGTSIGGKETLNSLQSLPEEAYPCPLEREGELIFSLYFEKGEPYTIDNTRYAHPTELIKELEHLAAPWAVGRDTHVGDTIIGIKGRVGFEAAAPLIILSAHKLLEKHTLSKWQQYWKEQLGNWYGMFIHEGLYLEPVMRDVEMFLESTQEYVSGKVHIRLRPYHFEAIGIESPYDMMNSSFGDYGEMNKAWSAEDIKGFTKVMSIPMQLDRARKKK